MNVWECSQPGCTVKALGCGGAIGLRAVGWHFLPGGRIFCPQHRPDKAPGRADLGCQMSECSTCAGEAEALRWQQMMNAIVGDSCRLRQVLAEILDMTGDPAIIRTIETALAGGQ
jgi:hypothetical protein